MSMKANKLKKKLCYCDSGKPFRQCCAPVLEGATADSAEQLMRSRYSAFCLQDKRYLLTSWHSSSRPAALELDLAVKWVSLRILEFQPDLAQPEVEFIARFKVQGRAQQMHERSKFVREQGHWRYLGSTATRHLA